MLKASISQRRRFSIAALQRINWRMMLIGAIILFVIGNPLYVFLKSTITGGIVRQGDVIEVDLKAMSMFEMDQANGVTEDVPKRFRELDGKRVVLSGEMWAPQTAAGQISGFDLVYSIGKCCFSGPPKVQHFVKSSVRNGGNVNYYQGPVNVIGTLHVGVQRADDRVQSVYRVDVDSVSPS